MKPLFSFGALAIFASATFAQDATPTPASTSETAPASSENSPAEENETVIVVTDTKTPKPLRDTTASVSVIGAERIETQEALNITEVLREVPGLSFSQSGTLGKATSLFTRGTNSNHTLVLIDGIRANASTSGIFDFGQFPPENIERIEVLRGPGSALYGADALGGVINIITRRGQGPLKTGGNLEFGSRSNNRQTVDFGGQLGQNRVSLTAFRLDSNGQFQNDDYRNTGLSLRLDRELTDKQELTFTTRFSRSKLGVPGQQNLSFDPFQRGEIEDWGSSLAWTNRDGARRDLVRLGLFDRNLNDDDTRSGPFPALVPSQIDEKTTMIEAQSSLQIGANLLTAGLESRREKSDVLAANAGYSFVDQNGQTVVVPPSNLTFARSRRVNAAFLQNEFKSGALTLVPGVRYEDNSQFGGQSSYRLAAAYEVSEQTKVRASYGTAFKAPTFNQLYYPGFSNPNLEPERSKGVELGVSQNWKGGNFGATAFQNRIRDLIEFSPVTFAPANLSRAKTRGIELSLDQNLGNGFRLLGAQTFLSARTESGRRLLRRPKTTTSLNLVHNSGKWTTDLGFFAQGDRLDNNFATDVASRTYDGFSIVNLTLGYKLRPGLEIYGRAGNVFNRKYEEVAGFPSPKFNISFGVKTAAF